jgi:hypothetical protein|tara:strand:- start:236 stop:598 length:363 start_codon:yes stop_codon:yes gene_type:complete
MITTKVNPLKLNETYFDSQYMKEKGRYVKRYFFSNGLGAIVCNHDKSYGGNSGYFEVWIIEHKHGTDPNMSYKVLESHPIHKRHGAVEVFGWLDHFEIADRLQEIRNYDTGEYAYNERTN